MPEGWMKTRPHRNITTEAPTGGSIRSASGSDIWEKMGLKGDPKPGLVLGLREARSKVEEPVRVLGCLLKKKKVSWSGMMMPSVDVTMAHKLRLSSSRKKSTVQKDDPGSREMTQ